MFGFNWSHTQKEKIFKFADGKRISADEFGYLSIRWSSELAAKFIGDMFGDTKPCSEYEFAKDIEAAPFFTHLTLTTFNSSIYYAYVKNKLQAEEVICSKFLTGIRRSFSEIRDGNGKPLHPELQSLTNNIPIYAKAIVDDEKLALSADPTIYNPLNTNATRLILSGLRGWYSTPDRRDLPDHLSSQSLVVAAQLDMIPVTLMDILQNHLKITISHS